jgi:hypothetical protein
LARLLHIVTWDIPYPADYGGAIEVFYKLKALQQKGVEVILHCFSYGTRNTVAPELKALCKDVHVYQRQSYLKFLFSKEPYIVASRRDNALLANLIAVDAPILFEGIHTTAWLHRPEIANRRRIVRVHNIESNYYWHLWQNESSFIKKRYFKQEFMRLHKYEFLLNGASGFCAMTSKDAEYFEHHYASLAHRLIPAFHGNNASDYQKTSAKSYCLYHGNLSISENNLSALWLVENVFSKMNMTCKIAGKRPGDALKEACKQHPHIEIIDSPSHQQLQQLITEAHINCLYTMQDTGIKLKMLNALYNGGLVVCNDLMLSGTKISKSITVANTASDWLQAIELNAAKAFDSDLQQLRAQDLEPYHDGLNAESLIDFLFDK